VGDKEDLMITCVSGVTIRTGISSISAQGRATQGVKLIRLDDEDQIAAITNLNEEEVEVETVETDIITPETDIITPEEGSSTENNTEETI
jgi:DNA gyrase subunit A